MTTPLLPTAVYNATEIAEVVFRHGVDWFYENRARLHAEEGFPRPVSKFGQPRWYGEDVIAWQRREKRAEMPQPAAGAVDFTAVLAARAAGIGRKRAS